ncbi:MAG TPA: hypothetical protein VNK04_23895 [Gemmataceae bacterium]|nr:hypothetical protein [Gemmataceae bacterium]
MLRTLSSAAIVALLVSGLALAQEKQPRQQDKDRPGAAGRPTPATITKVDPVKNTITLRMKDNTGKETEKTFELKGDVKLFDEAGKVITIDAYRVGNQVLVIEREGRILELRKDKGTDRPGETKKPSNR